MRTVILIALMISIFAAPVNGQLVIQLHNWNLISINVIPPDEMYSEDEDRGPDVELMFEQIIDNLIEVRDENGNRYVPAMEYNDIEFWDLTEAYWIYVDEDVQVTFTGEQIPANADIPLTAGWNWITYYPTYELDASYPDFYVLSPIIDYVLIAKDNRGDFMSTELDFSNMDPWRPGRGYEVLVIENVILNYPEEPEGVIEISKAPAKFTLLQNYPNPFNSATLLKYHLSQPSLVHIQVFDLSGKYITTILQDNQIAGSHSVVWDAGEIPSGNYIFLLRSGYRIITSNSLLVR